MDNNPQRIFQLPGLPYLPKQLRTASMHEGIHDTLILIHDEIKQDIKIIKLQSVNHCSEIKITGN